MRASPPFEFRKPLVLGAVVALLVSACAGNVPAGGVLRVACGDTSECAEGLICISGACLVPSCALDTFFDVAAGVCTPCAEGFVSAGRDVQACTAIACDIDQFWSQEERACLPCDAGTRSEGGAVTACVSIDCALDTRWDEVGRACVTCEPDTFSAGGSADACEPYDCVLDESWNADLRRCVPCARGTTSDGGASACTPIDCALDHAWRSDVRSCFPCTEGEVSDGGFVTTCDPIDCPRDAYWDAPRRGCFTCPAAHTSPGGASTSCAPVTCDRDTFWDRTTGECLPCPTGTTSAGGAVTTCSVIDCAVNERWDTAAFACVPCGEHEASPGGFVTTCTPIDCARGQRWSAAQRTCLDCDDGMFSPGGTSTVCVPIDCVKGERWDAVSFACIACDAGYTTGGGYVTACEDIDECLEGTAACSTNAACTNSPGSYTCGCDEGFWGDGVDCKSWSVCPAGTDVSRAGTSVVDRSCEACAPETFSTTTNVAACTPWTQTSCAPGHGYAAGSATSDSTCRQCAAGSSSDGKDGCQTCGPESWSADGASSCKTWTTCSAGQYVSQTPNATGDRGCTDCATSTFSTEQNAASCAAWTTCSAGQYVEASGTAISNRICANCTDIEHCASGLTCTTSTDQVCGTCVTNYSGSGTNQCYVNCAKGSYWTGAACATCSSGQTSAGGSVTSCTNINCAVNNFWDATQQNCIACPSGQTSDGGAVTSCTPTGRRCSVYEKWDAGTQSCVPCPSGQTSLGGLATTCATVSAFTPIDFDVSDTGAPVTLGYDYVAAKVQRFEPSGTAAGPPFVAFASGNMSSYYNPIIARSKASGGFAVAQPYNPGTGDGLGTVVVKVKAFAADATPVNDGWTIPGRGDGLDLAMDDMGRLVVVAGFNDLTLSGTDRYKGPIVRFYDTGANLYATLDMTAECKPPYGYSWGMSVSVHPTNGTGVVSCQGNSSDPVRFRRFSMNGTWLDAAATTVTTSSSWYITHRVAMTAAGGVAATWTDSAKQYVGFYGSNGAFLAKVELASIQGVSQNFDTFRGRHVRMATVGADILVPYFSGSGTTFLFDAYARFDASGVRKGSAAQAGYGTWSLAVGPTMTWALSTSGALMRDPFSLVP